LGLREPEGPIRWLERKFFTRTWRVGRGEGAELEDAAIKLEKSKIKRGAGRAYTTSRGKESPLVTRAKMKRGLRRKPECCVIISHCHKFKLN